MTNSTTFITTTANFSNNTTSESNMFLVNFYIQCFMLILNRIGFSMFST